MIGLACATISCDGFDDNDFRASFRILPNVGFRYIEFNAWYPSAVTPAKMADLCQRCAATALLPACLHGMGFGTSNAVKTGAECPQITGIRCPLNTGQQVRCL